MAYLSNIPQPIDNLSTSQGQMLANFGVLNSFYGMDHFPYTDATHTGFHKQVTFNDVAAPGAQTAPSSISYTKTVGTTPQEELFFKNSKYETQITSNGNAIWKGSPVSATDGEVVLSAATNGYINFPNGLILQWGIITSPTQHTTTDVLFATANINFPNACFNVTATLINAGGTTNVQTVSIRNGSLAFDRFSYNYSGGSAYNGFYWFAIGN